VSVLLGLPIALVSPWIMGLYGEGFAPSWPVLAVVCACSILWAVNVVVGQAIWSIGATGTAMALAAARMALILAFFRWWIEQGAMGLALAYLATYVLMTLYQGGYLWWRVRMQERRTVEVGASAQVEYDAGGAR